VPIVSRGALRAALRRVATLVARATPPQDVFAAVAEEVGRLLAADFASLVRYDPPDTLEVVGTWTSASASAGPVGGRLPLGGRNVGVPVSVEGRLWAPWWQRSLTRNTCHGTPRPA
jgi:GAF domain-containing protein